MNKVCQPENSVTAAPSAGHINIYLSVDQYEYITEVSIRNERPKNLGNILIGLEPEQALQRIPTVFLLCSQAQQCAAYGAMLSVLGQEMMPEQFRQSYEGCALEWLKEHSWQLWQMERELFGEDFAMHDSITLSRELLTQLRHYPKFTLQHNPAEKPTKTDWTRVQEMLTPLFGITPAHFLSFSISDLKKWSQSQAPYARLLDAMLDNSVSRLGTYEQWDISHESGSISRQKHPLLDHALEHWGNGLFTRTLARLIEMASVCQHPELASPEKPGQAKASRGSLQHSVEINAQGIISRYDIDAPTDRYFCNGGLVKQSLLGQQLPELTWVRQLIWAIDPCVEFTVTSHAHNKEN